MENRTNHIKEDLATIKSRLSELVHILLDESLSYNTLKETVDEVYFYLKELSGVSGLEEKFEYLANVPTASGLALSMNHAAQCLLDYNRTVALLRGMVAAIKKKREASEGPVHIFYAGCGPYAPFMTLLTSLYSENEIKYSLLEINEHSAEAVKRLIASLKVDKYILDVIVDDAIEYKIKYPHKYDILFSETLDALLYRESYVPILFGMIPQLNNEVFIIPENVVVNLYWAFGDIQNNAEKEEFVGELINVREMIDQYDQEQFLPDEVMKYNAKLPALAPDGMVLETRVKVHDNIFINRMESSVTIPLRMAFEKPPLFSEIRFSYQIRPTVELTSTYLDAGGSPV